MTDTPMFLISREELDQVKNDCAYPEKYDCENCKYYHGAKDLPCTFKGANALMDEVLTRPLEAELKTERKKILDDLCNLFRWTNKTGNFITWNIDHIEQVIRTYRETSEENHE